MQEKTKKIISVSKEGRDRLQQAYGCRRETIYNALAYRSDSPMARDIRIDALTIYGGREYDKPIL